MKTQSKITGTIAAFMGIVFASGDTFTNGFLAIVCFGIAVCAFLFAEGASSETSTNARKAAKRAKRVA